jgi:hypothetical protein
MPRTGSRRPRRPGYRGMIRKITTIRSFAATKGREKSLSQRLKELPNTLIQRVKKAAAHRLREVAPPGLDPTTQNDIGDAFRHYNSSAELQRIAGSTIARPIGEALESGPNNPNSKAMDLANNEAGIRSAEENPRGDRTDTALNFMIDVAKGNITILDQDKGIRRTTPADLPSKRDDRPLKARL